MRSPMMVASLPPIRRAAMLALWAAATLALAATLPSLSPLLLSTVAVLAFTGVYLQFDSATRAGPLRPALLRTPRQGSADSFAQHFVAREFAAARRGGKLTLVMFGLAQLEQFREREGSEAAAAALREFGRVLQQLTREMNLSARYGWRSDAFLCVLSGVDADVARVFIGRVRAAVAASVVPMPRVDAGLATYQSDTASPEELVEAAERALAAARAAVGAPRHLRYPAPARGRDSRDRPRV